MHTLTRPQMRSAWLLVVLALGGCTRVLVPPGRPAPAPPATGPQSDVNAPFRHPDVETWQQRFESPKREVYRLRHEIVAAMQLRPGTDVADIGAGTGFFTLLFARAVGPQGRVYAVDIAEEFLAAIRERAAAAGLTNVVTVRCPEREVALPAGSIDLAFICDTYHHFADPVAYMGSVRRALRPGGRLVVIDFERIEGRSPAWILRHVRAGREEVIEQIRRAGFEPIEPPAPVPPLGQNYMIWFVRR